MPTCDLGVRRPVALQPAVALDRVPFPARDGSKYQRPWARRPFTVTVVACCSPRASVIGCEKYAIIGIPTP